MSDRERIKELRARNQARADDPQEGRIKSLDEALDGWERALADAEAWKRIEERRATERDEARDLVRRLAEIARTEQTEEGRLLAITCDAEAKLREWGLS